MKPGPRNQYGRRLQEKREQLEGTPRASSAKPISEMSESELDAEEERLRRELRAAKEQVVEVGRQELQGAGQRRRLFLPKKKRPYWR